MPQTDLKNETGKKHFRVALFGSARIQKDDEIFKQAFALAKSIGENGFDVVTGGGPGLMEAASSGHQASHNGNNHIHTIGLTIKLPEANGGKNENAHLDIKTHFDKFSERLDEFMILSNVVVVLPGGVGTCLEFFYTWQLTQVKHICNIPILLLGDMWKELLDWIEKWPLKQGLITPQNMSNLQLVKDNEHAMRVIKKAHELYEKLGDSYCLNWKKYKLD